jgi:hypothetical protein
LPVVNPLEIFSRSAELPGSWADWAQSLTRIGTTEESSTIFRLSEDLARAAGISTEAATGLLLWLGSVCMIQHTQIQWSTGIWHPAGLVLATVEGDDVPIDSITNAFIDMARGIGLDPISDTVKEGPAGLIARLESSGRPLAQQRGSVRIDSLDALSQINTANIESRFDSNRGNGRALIYPSGRAILSYLYDTPFFNALDELVQHGNLSIRGKHDRHQLNRVHLSMFTAFYQGSLVTLTTDSRVQNNMLALMRQLMVLWPTSGTRRHKRAGNIANALYRIDKIATDGVIALRDLSDGTLMIPDMPRSVSKGFIDEGVGVRYTMLNREQRIAKLAIAVAFWRIATGGRFEVTQEDCAIADTILHSHEMGGRLLELSISKGKLGHEFMRVFLRLLDGEVIESGEEVAHASDLTIGATAVRRLGDMSIITSDGKLADEYRYVAGPTIAAHKKRWNLN